MHTVRGYRCHWDQTSVEMPTLHFATSYPYKYIQRRCLCLQKIQKKATTQRRSNSGLSTVYCDRVVDLVHSYMEAYRSAKEVWDLSSKMRLWKVCVPVAQPGFYFRVGRLAHWCAMSFFGERVILLWRLRWQEFGSVEHLMVYWSYS